MLRRTLLICLLCFFTTNCSLSDVPSSIQKTSIISKLSSNASKQSFAPRKLVFDEKSNNISFLRDLSIPFFGKIDQTSTLKKEATQLGVINNNAELFDCIRISEDKNQAIVSCKRKHSGIFVKDNYLRFFFRKYPGHSTLTKVSANWHNYPFNKATLKNEKYFVTKLKSLKKDILYIKHLTKYYVPTEEKILAMRWSGAFKISKEWYNFEADNNFNIKYLKRKKQQCSFSTTPRVGIVTPHSLDKYSIENEMRGGRNNFIPTTATTPAPWTPHHEYCKIPGLKIKDSFDDNLCGVDCGLNNFGNAETFTNSEPLSNNYGKFNITSNNECLRDDCSHLGFSYTMEGTFVKNMTTLPYQAHISGLMCPNVPGYWPELIGGYPISCSQKVDVQGNLKGITNKCQCSELEDGVNERICKKETLHRRALYHAQRLLHSLNSDIGVSVPNKIELGIVDFFAEKNEPTEAVGLCGETHTPILSAPQVKISASLFCGNSTENMGAFQGTVYHEITHAVEDHLGVSGPYQKGYPTNEYSAASEARAIYIGGSFTRFSDTPAPRIGMGYTSPGVPQRNFYPNDFNKIDRCPDQLCSPHIFSDIWVNTYISLEKMIGQRDTVRLVFHNPIFTNSDANFVHPRDLHPECSITPPENPSVFSGAKSYYEAMIEADDHIYFGKHRLEIWKAFGKSLVNPNCLKKYDDVGNEMSSASYINIRGENRVSSYNPSGLASINHEFDEDWFYVYSPAEKSLSINIDTLNNIQLKLRVRNKSGNILLDTTNFSQPIEFITTQQGMYYIQILRNSDISGPTQGDYSISINSVPINSPDRESNSMNEESEPIPLSNSNNSGVLTTGRLDNSQDIDTFRFWMNSGQIHNVQFELIGSSSNQNFSVKLEVYDENLSQKANLLSSGNNNLTNLQSTLNGGQWYFLKVFSPNQTIGDYGIKVATDSFSVDMKDAKGAFVLQGTTTSKAIDDLALYGPSFLLEPYGLRSRIAATIVNEQPRFYKFYLTKNQKIKLQLNSISSPSLAINLKLYERTSTVLDSNGQEFQSLYSLSSLRKNSFEKNVYFSSKQVDLLKSFLNIQENVNNTTMYFTALKTGWYLAEITPIDQASFGSYKISLTSDSLPATTIMYEHQCQENVP